MTAKFW